MTRRVKPEKKISIIKVYLFFFSILFSHFFIKDTRLDPVYWHNNTSMAAIDPTKHYQLPNDCKWAIYTFLHPLVLYWLLFFCIDLALADDQLPFTLEESLGTFCEVWNINSWSAFERLQVDKIAGPEIITDQLKW